MASLHGPSFDVLPEGIAALSANFHGTYAHHLFNISRTILNATAALVHAYKPNNVVAHLSPVHIFVYPTIISTSKATRGPPS